MKLDKGNALLKRDQAVVSPSYPRAAPFVMERGAGSEVWDVDGNRFIDFAAGIAVCTTGHSHPKVVAAICEQAERFIHISSDYYHPVWVEISERLAGIAPFSEPAKVFLSNSGTEAVEAGIKLALHHSGRPLFIGFQGGFHGRTLGSLAFTSSKSIQRSGFGAPSIGVTHVPYPNAYRQVLQPTSDDYGETVVNYIEDHIFKTVVPPGDCAAILVEPIQGEGGYIVPPPGFFPALRELCDRHGILLIVDEVQSGIGRTGKWWAIEHWDVEPDIVCFAKGVASGVPMGGILARASVMDWPEGAHSNTYGGNPLACRAALATLDLVEGEFMDNAKRMGEYAMDALEEIQGRHATIGEIRGKGLMIGVELVDGDGAKQPAHDLRERLIEEAFERGLLLLGCGESSVRLAPALSIDERLLDEGLRIMEESISTVST
ncbi:MAG: acetyl ornithine aminotransferase family protein [Chloroflexi bacterium]|nr:acetyl ornithine aminotransferase family protein [Chloroflexota bacterium]MCH8340101.1 acetyl ornithine aminotransferase family protein [Chloroflexota bacterium]